MVDHPVVVDRVSEPRWLSSRRAVALFLAGFSALCTLYVTQPILTDLAAAFAVPVSATTWTITLGTLGVAVAAPVAGAVSDRWGRRRLMGPMIMAMAVPMAASAVVGSLSMLLLMRFAQGMLIPLVFTSAVAYAQEEAADGRGGRLNAVYVSGTVAGGFTGRFLTGLVTEHVGWPAAFLVLAVLIGVVGLAVLVLLPPQRRFTPAASLTGALRRLGGHWRNPGLLGACALGAALLFAQVAAFTYTGLLLAGPPFRFGADALGAVFAVYVVGAFVTPIAGGGIDRFGRRPVLAVAIGVSCAGLLISQFPTAGTVIAGLACCSLGIFIGQACATNAAARFAPQAASSAVGLYVTSYYIGGGVGAQAPAPVWQVAGWPGVAALTGFLLVAGVTTALLTWRAGTGRPYGPYSPSTEKS